MADRICSVHGREIKFDNGYFIPTEDLYREGLMEWLQHMRGKSWWNHKYEEAFHLTVGRLERRNRKTVPLEV